VKKKGKNHLVLKWKNFYSHKKTRGKGKWLKVAVRSRIENFWALNRTSEALRFKKGH